MPPPRPLTPREICRMLQADGWTERKGKGDHKVFNKPGAGNISVDMGPREIPVGTLRSIFRKAGWAW